MHGKRVISGVVFIPLFVWLVQKGPFVLFWLLIAAASCIGLCELYNVLEKAGIETFRTLGISIGAVFSLLFVHDVSHPTLVFFGSACFFVFLYSIFFCEDLSCGIRRISGTCFGMYIPILMYHILLIWKLPHGRSLILALMITIWMGDTCAYYVGKNFGKHKLAPVISPNKTVEGLLGAFLGNFLGAVFLKFFILPARFSFPHFVAIALLVGCVGQLGDLFESLLKRGAGVKDSGNVIPGHGGMLDRLDSLIFTAPLFFYLVS